MAESSEAVKEKWHYLMAHALGAEYVRDMLVERDVEIERLKQRLVDSVSQFNYENERLKQQLAEAKRWNSFCNWR